jgi:hypothetical protein
MATKSPNDPYVQPSGMNQPSQPRPTSGSYPPPLGAMPSAAFDELEQGLYGDGGSTLAADGDCYQSTLD